MTQSDAREDDESGPGTEYDDPDERDDRDQIIFDADAYAAMQRLRARWLEDPSTPPPAPGGACATTGRHHFTMRLADLADAIIALKLKKKPLPVRFELLPNRLRLSVESETGLVCQVDAPLKSGPLAADVCFERGQGAMINLARIRDTYPGGAEIACEINLSQRYWEITPPPDFEESLRAGRRRGPKRRAKLCIGIVVPESRVPRPWEVEGLGEGRPVDVGAVARAVGCAQVLMSHHPGPREPAGIDVARGRAVAASTGAFYHVTDASLEGLEFRVAPPDCARFQRALARMQPETARCHSVANAQVFTDGVLICAVPRPEHPFPAMERGAEDLDYDDVEILQNREKPFYKLGGTFLFEGDGLVTAELIGLPGAFSVSFVGCSTHPRRSGSKFSIYQWSRTSPASASQGAAGPSWADEIVTVDEPGPLEVVRQEITISSKAAYQVLMRLPTGPVRLRFSRSRVLAVRHELAGMQATAYFANRAPLVPPHRA